MLKYIVYKSGVNNATKDKWYARIVHEETVDIEGLAEHMRRHNSPFSKGQLLAILTDIVGCIKELCLESKSVRIDGLGIFEARVRSKGAKTRPEFNIAENVLNLVVCCRGVDEFRSSRLEVNTKHNLAKIAEVKPTAKADSVNTEQP